MQDPHVVCPGVGAGPLQVCVKQEHSTGWGTYMVELVEINLVAVLGVLLRPLDTWANEEKVADHFANHLLVLVSVINILPVSVLGK